MTQTEFWEYIFNRIRKLWNPLFMLSAVVVTYMLTLNYSVIIEYTYFDSTDYTVRPDFALLAAGLMLPVYWYAAYGKNIVRSTMKKMNAVTGWTAFAVACAVVYQLVTDTQVNFAHIYYALEEDFPKADPDSLLSSSYAWLMIGCVVTSFAVFIFVAYAVKFLRELCIDLYRTADKSEKIYFVLALIGGVSLICFFYSRTSGQWSTVDWVYQTDSQLVYEHYYPVFSNGYEFDWDIGNGGIRHPLVTLYTYPIYVIVSFFTNILFWIPNIRPILYAVIQVIVMVLTVIMLKRMIKSNWIYLIFSVSFPFIFFTIFIEKYQLATFFAVMFAYSVVTRRKKEVQGYFLIAAGGMMITSAFLGFFYGTAKSFRNKLKGYGKVFGMFLLTLIGTGRIGYILNFVYLLDYNFQVFNGRKLFSQTIRLKPLVATCTIEIPKITAEAWALVVRKLCAFFNLIASCFVPIPYEIIPDWEMKDIFYWRSVTGELNILGIVIFVFMIVTIVRHRKDKTTQIFALWLLWMVIQIALIGFSAGCSPLFSLYFGWAVISLVMIGLKDILKTPAQQLFGYGVIAFVMLYSNYAHLQDLYLYMIEKTPLP